MSEAQINKTIWPLIFISYASLFVFGLSDNIRGPLFPEILNDFHTNDSIGSLMFALSSISGFIASHFARGLLNRYDRKSILQGASLCMSLTLIGLASATHFYFFLFLSVIFGLCSGMIGLIPNILVPLGASVEKRQQFISGLHAMYGIASLLAPLLVAGISSMSGSWRHIYYLTSLAPLSLFLYSFHKSHNDLHPKPSISSETRKENKKRNFKPQVFLAFMVSFAVAAEVMISSRLALYMRRVWNYDLESSSLYVTYFFVCLLLGRLLFAGVKFKKSLSFQLTGCLLLSALFFLLGLYIHPMFLTIIGFSISPFYPLAISLISSEFPEDLDTAVSYMMATDSMMLALMHVLVGKLSDNYGIQTAIFTGLIFLSFSLIFVNTYKFFFKKIANEN